MLGKIIGLLLIGVKLLLFCLMNILSNCPLNSSLYPHRLVQLSDLIRGAPLCSEQQVKQNQLKYREYVSLDPTWHISITLSPLRAQGPSQKRVWKYCEQLGIKKDRSETVSSTCCTPEPRATVAARTRPAREQTSQRSDMERKEAQGLPP